MTVSCRTFSLGHVLMGYAVGAAIRIACGDRDGAPSNRECGDFDSETLMMTLCASCKFARFAHAADRKKE